MAISWICQNEVSPVIVIPSVLQTMVDIPSTLGALFSGFVAAV